MSRSHRVNEILGTYANILKKNKEVLNFYFPQRKEESNAKYLLFRNKTGEIYGFFFKYQISTFLFFDCLDKHCRGVGRYNISSRNFFLCQKHNITYEKHESISQISQFHSTIKTLKNNLNIDSEIIFE